MIEAPQADAYDKDDGQAERLRDVEHIQARVEWRERAACSFHDHHIGTRG